jgi:hypothetical protein
LNKRGCTVNDTTLWNIDEVAQYLRVPVLTVRWLVWDARDITAWLDAQREVQAA